MKYSIIIPLYNKEKYIKKTLESIDKQLNKNIEKELEVIIINDLSTDKSLEEVKKFLKNSAKVYKVIENKENIGVSKSRNIGIDHSTGKYILFLDADDSLKNNFFYEVEEVLKNDKIDFLCLTRIYSSRNEIEYNYNAILKKYGEKIQENLYSIVDYEKILMKKIFLGGSGEILLKKKLLIGCKFDEKLSLMEDYDFYFKILTNIKKIYFYTKPLVIVEDYVENSLSSRKIKYENCENFKILDNVFINNEKRLKQKIFWILMFSNLSRLNFKDRIKLLKREQKNITNLFSVNKYSISSFFITVGIDLNEIRRKLKNGKYRIKHNSSNI